jgi:uncharacterized Rmd1/YagE family protein
MQDQRLLKGFARCVSFCTAGSYDLLGIANFFRKRGYYTRLLRDVLHVTNLKSPGDLYFFNHGSFVAWGFKKKFEDKLLEELKAFAIQPLATIEIDNFYYRVSTETVIDVDEKYHLDIINLESDDPMLKLAMSYGLAQSIKLETFEEAIQVAIRANSHLPDEIALRGEISLSRRAIFKRIGEIFIARSSINLNIEYLDVPEFFWRNPNLESYYVMAKQYLDIPSRVMALNQKLDVLQELLDILNSQVQHRHSSLLESIIILLIFVEIIISLFQLHVV